MSQEDDPARWDAEYSAGRWDLLGGLHEAARYSLVSGLLRHLDEPCDVLDVGCGEGLLLHRLDPNRCKRYVGVDHSAVALERARRRATLCRVARAAFICADVSDGGAVRAALERKDPGRTRFGAIVFNEVLYYLGNPTDVLKDYKELLIVGGAFLISMHVNSRSPGLWDAIDREYEALDAVRLTSAKGGLTWTCKLCFPRQDRSATGLAAVAADGSWMRTAAPRVAAALLRRSHAARLLARRLRGVVTGLTAVIDEVGGVSVGAAKEIQVTRDLLGSVGVRGWAVDELLRVCPGTVYLDVDGVPREVHRGVYRADVERSRGEPTYRHCGFAATLRLSPGAHTLAVVAQDHSGVRRTRSRLTRVCVAEAGVVLVLDTVAGVPAGQSSEIEVRADPEGEVRFVGWAVDGASRRPAAFVDVTVDGTRYEAGQSVPRDDVARVHRSPELLRSGFSLRVPLSEGVHDIVVRAGTDGDAAARSLTLRVFHPWALDLGRRFASARTAVLARRHASTLASLARGPRFSVVLTAYETEPGWLRRALESVVGQVYPHWELCAVDDGSTRPHVWDLLREFARRDPRIRIERTAVNGHMSAAANRALSLARGDYVAFLDHDDELTPEALLEVARDLVRDPDTDFVYTDECVISPDGETLLNDRKPGWSPDTLLSHMYTGHLSVLRRRLVERLGGMREGYEGAQDYDLVLRAVRAGARVSHVEQVLYRWRAVKTSVAGNAHAKPYAEAAALKALRDHVADEGLDAEVEPGPHLFTYRVRYRVRSPPPVAALLLAPARHEVSLSSLAVLIAKASYRPLRIYLVHDPAQGCGEVPLSLSGTGIATGLLPCPELKLVPEALASITEDFVLQLGPGFCPCRADWLTSLVEHATRPEVGAVGARLMHGRDPLSEAQRRLLAQTVHNAAALRSTSLLTRKELLADYGSARPAGLMSAEQDAAYARFVRSRGYRLVYTPYADV